MKKRTILLVAVCVVALLCGCAFGQFLIKSKRPSPQEMLDKIGDAVVNVMGDDTAKVSQSKIVPITLVGAQGDELIYYVCQTEWMDEECVTSGLSPVLDQIIDPETADSTEYCQVNGLDAALYHKDDRAYLCWTVSAEYSLALEYDPDILSEEEIFKIAESVPIEHE